LLFEKDINLYLLSGGFYYISSVAIVVVAVVEYQFTHFHSPDFTPTKGGLAAVRQSVKEIRKHKNGKVSWMETNNKRKLNPNKGNSSESFEDCMEL